MNLTLMVQLETYELNLKPKSGKREKGHGFVIPSNKN